MKESSLKEKTARGLFWGGFSNGIQQLLNLVFGIFLARLLDRSDYGMVGLLTVFSAVASALQEGGFISALTNRSRPNTATTMQSSGSVRYAALHSTSFCSLPRR